MIYHDELVSGELGQIGTQFDGLGPHRHRRSLLQRQQPADFAKAEGYRSSASRTSARSRRAACWSTSRRYKGVERLAGGYEITLADLQGALRKQKTEIRSGDVVLVHTGWGTLWMVDNAKFNASAPGIGLEAARYLVEREVVMVGADTWAIGGRAESGSAARSSRCISC